MLIACPWFSVVAKAHPREVVSQALAMVPLMVSMEGVLLVLMGHPLTSMEVGMVHLRVSMEGAMDLHRANMEVGMVLLRASMGVVMVLLKVSTGVAMALLRGSMDQEGRVGMVLHLVSSKVEVQRQISSVAFLGELKISIIMCPGVLPLVNFTQVLLDAVDNITEMHFALSPLPPKQC